MSRRGSRAAAASPGTHLPPAGRRSGHREGASRRSVRCPNRVARRRSSPPGNHSGRLDWPSVLPARTRRTWEGKLSPLVHLHAERSRARDGMKRANWFAVNTTLRTGDVAWLLRWVSGSRAKEILARSGVLVALIERTSKDCTEQRLVDAISERRTPPELGRNPNGGPITSVDLAQWSCISSVP